MKKSKILSIFLGICLFFGMAGQVQAQATIKLWINGSYVKSDVDPMVENQRTLVPIRIISENLGKKVDWNPKDNSVLISSTDGKAITLYIGRTKYLVNGNTFTADVAPRVKNNRTLVPIRLVAELFNQKVDWDQKNQTVVIGQGYTPNETSKAPGGPAEAILSLTNKERAKAGLAPLTLDPVLNEVAQIKAKDMADNKYFSHNSPVFGETRTLLDQRHYPYFIFAENLSKKAGGAEASMAAWMASPGHRANILNPMVTYLGVAYSPQGGWVQIFASKQATSTQAHRQLEAIIQDLAKKGYSQEEITRELNKMLKEGKLDLGLPF